jgi:hypothetical protein
VDGAAARDLGRKAGVQGKHVQGMRLFLHADDRDALANLYEPAVVLQGKTPPRTVTLPMAVRGAQSKRDPFSSLRMRGSRPRVVSMRVRLRQSMPASSGPLLPGGGDPLKLRKERARK